MGEAEEAAQEERTSGWSLVVNWYKVVGVCFFGSLIVLLVGVVVFLLYNVVKSWIEFRGEKGTGTEALRKADERVAAAKKAFDDLREVDHLIRANRWGKREKEYRS